MQRKTYKKLQLSNKTVKKCDLDVLIIENKEALEEKCAAWGSHQQKAPIVSQSSQLTISQTARHASKLFGQSYGHFSHNHHYM